MIKHPEMKSILRALPPAAHKELLDFLDYLQYKYRLEEPRPVVHLGGLSFPDDSSVDYVFTDPPFGHNIQYSELNFLWETWLKVATCPTPEAVINEGQKKDLDDYRTLMLRCFQEAHRVLKPGRWITVVFHNSKAAV